MIIISFQSFYCCFFCFCFLNFLLHIFKKIKCYFFLLIHINLSISCYLFSYMSVNHLFCFYLKTKDMLHSYTHNTKIYLQILRLKSLIDFSSKWIIEKSDFLIPIYDIYSWLPTFYEIISTHSESSTLFFPRDQCWTVRD